MFMLVSQLHGGVIQAAGRCCGAYSFVCMYVCMFLFCFVLCYYAILTRQFTVSFFCLVPVYTLSGFGNKIQVTS